jgi:hypothetical protein
VAADIRARPPDTRGGIVLYDDPYFRGNSLPMNGPSENLRFQRFHDRAESVRVLSGRWELCAEPNFRRCQIVDRDIQNLSSIGTEQEALLGASGRIRARVVRGDGGGTDRLLAGEAAPAGSLPRE